MTKVSATFSTGETIARNTTMNLTHAWQWHVARKDGTRFYGSTGFASSHDLAVKAANASARVILGKKDKRTPAVEVVPLTKGE